MYQILLNIVIKKKMKIYKVITVLRNAVYIKNYVKIVCNI